MTQYFDWAVFRTYRRPGEQVDLDPRVDGLNVLDRREQVCWRIIDIKAGKTVIGGRRKRIACRRR